MSELPTWFLIATLFLPRLSLVGAYFLGIPQVTALASGFLPVALAVVFARVVVILLIYATLGWSWWLVPHCLALVSFSAAVGRRRRS